MRTSSNLSWAAAHFGSARAMASYVELLIAHAEAHPFRAGDPLVVGLIYGPPEHDTGEPQGHT